MTYPADMPDYQRRKLDAVPAEQRPQLIELWHAAQAYEAQLASGDRYTQAIEARHAAEERKRAADARLAKELREQHECEQLATKAFTGALGADAKEIALHIRDSAPHGTTQERLYREIRNAVRRART